MPALTLASESFPEPGLPALSPLPASRPDLRPDASLPLPCLPPEPLSPFLPALSPFFFSSSLPSALPDELRSSSAAAARIASCARERWRNGVGRRSVDVTGWSLGVTASSECGRNGARGRWTGFDGERRRKSFDVVFGLGKKRALVGDVRSGVGHSPVRGWRRFGPHPSRWPLHVWHHSRQPPPWPRRVREPTPRPWKRAPSPREIRVFLPSTRDSPAISLSGKRYRAAPARQVNVNDRVRTLRAYVVSIVESTRTRFGAGHRERVVVETNVGKAQPKSRKRT